MIRYLYIFAVLATSTLAFAQRNLSASTECYKSGGHADARNCLEQKAEQSRANLHLAEESLKIFLASWDQEQQYKSDAANWLVKSSSLFDQYRQSQCELQASLAAGANGASDRRLLCIIELNEKRSLELQNTIESRERGFEPKGALSP